MTHHFDNEQKVSILVSGLEERYKSIHAIRERIQNICVWALGLMLAASGWLIQSDVEFSPCQKLLYIVGVVVAFWALRFNFLDDLYKGFQKQQQVAVRLEKALGLFTPKTFDDEESSLYPKEWENAGSNNGSGRFFASTYLLLYIGVAVLILAILLHEGGHTFHQMHYFPYFVR
ncbi:MAG: hypothetical protein ABA06_01300 [Parcubacteria bacterium C7867-001]|nr:MAG: hypothetical protein ABA06_01300 [Parcubacteria bacterium C7867-001]